MGNATGKSKENKENVSKNIKYIWTLEDVKAGRVNADEVDFPDLNTLGWQRSCRDHNMRHVINAADMHYATIRAKCILSDHLQKVVRLIYEKGFAIFQLRPNDSTDLHFYAFIDILSWQQVYETSRLFLTFRFRNEAHFHGYRFLILYWYPSDMPDPIRSYAQDVMNEQYPILPEEGAQQ